MATLTADLQAEIDRLRQNAGRFTSVYDEFQRIRGYTVNNPALAAEWEKANSYASNVKSVIGWINSQVDGAYSWIKNIFGLDGMDMGVLPAIPALTVAYVTAAISALVFAVDWMLKIISEAETERQKIQLVSEGKADSSILKSDSGIVADSATLIKWASIGLLAYAVYKRYGKGR